MKRRKVLLALPIGLSAVTLNACKGKTMAPTVKSTSNIITLKNQNMSLELNPQLGGSVTGLRWQGDVIFRPTPAAVDDVTQTSSFPLVPIVNRIPNGEFTFQGRDINLAGNFMGQPEFIHGYGWLNSWIVTEQGDHYAKIRFDYPGAEWPWPFKAEQTFRLTPNSLMVELSVTNLSDSDMPADLGFHPYFPTTEKTRLFANYEGHWVNDDRGVSYKRVKGSFRQDFTKGARPSDSEMTDQTHFGWDGRAVLKEEGRPDIMVTADKACQNLHIFFPPNGNYVAIEPTLGRGNPFGALPREYRVLAPGETTSIWMKISIG